MENLDELLEKVTRMHYSGEQGNRAELFKDANLVRGSAFIYKFKGEKKGRNIAFSAHIDTMFGEFSKFHTHKDNFHGTLDNSACVTLLMMLKEELREWGKLRNSITLYFTKQEEPYGEYALFPFYSASNLVNRMPLFDLVVTLDARWPMMGTQKEVVIENCNPMEIKRYAKKFRDHAFIKSGFERNDESSEYKRRFPTLSLGPMLFSYAGNYYTGYMHNPKEDLFMTRRSLEKTYQIMKWIANTDFSRILKS